MPRHMSRTVLALAAALAVALASAGSLALAAEGHRSHAYRGHDPGSKQDKRCHGKRVSGLDKRWLKVHIQTNLFEIAGGQAAVDRAVTREVREFGAELVRDHTAALEEATALAQRLRVNVPAEPAPLQRWALRATQEFSGIDFDRWFTDLQVEGHRQAIVEAVTEVAKGCNRKVRRLAAASLPVLQRHLTRAEEILAELGD
jgi:putative membrane protein